MGNTAQWDERYRRGEHASETPAAFVEELAKLLPPGRVLDLACGAGRHALFLARRGWHVVAVDGSSVAIDLLQERCPAELAPKLETLVAELETAPFVIEPDSFDLILDCFYLNRSLFPQLSQGVRPGGHLAFAIHLTSQPHPRRLMPGELRAAFPTWQIVLERERTDPERITPGDHQGTAELLLRRPA